MKRRRATANLIDFDEESYDDEMVINEEETSTQGRINALWQELMGMPQEERERLVKDIGPQEDFPSV